MAGGGGGGGGSSGGGGGGGGGISPLGPAPPMWYHRDLSRAAAEELLARAGRDGSFLTSQGVQPKRFKTLPELVSLYLQPSQGLVTTLLYTVDREETAISDDRDYSDGEDEKPPLPPRSASTSTPPGPDTPTDSAPAANGLSTISHEYLKGSYALDLEAVKQGACALPHLNKTLVASCKRLNGEVDKVLSGLEILSKVFDQQSAFMVSKMIQQALKALQDMSLSSPCSPPPLSMRHSKAIPVQAFEVKLDVYLAELTKIGKSQKYTLSVDVEGGRLVVMKKVKDSQEDWTTFTHDKSSVPSPKSVATWVLCRGLGKTLDEMTVTIPHDLYVFGSQENSVCDREWVESLRAILKEQTELDYKPIAVQTLWNIKIAVLVKPEHENRISHVGMSSVKTGIANTLGNKGAVGVSFMFNGTSFGFVNCHLTSGNEKIARRNQNYLDILRLLSLGDKQLSSFDISLRFTHLFWLGDLNYRLDMDIQEILNYINRKEFDPLLKVDQLNLEREKNKVFLRFAEEEISFPPTYRYERGSRDTYVWQKQKATGMRTNVPSWCDRILWKSYPETHIVCNSYGCTDDIVTSDHSPVFATFEVGVTSQFVSKKGLPKSSEQAYIEFESIEAIVKTASRTKFFIEFYSTCLEEFKKSYENDSQSSDNVNFLRVGWSNKQLTTLKPLLSEIEYLQDQHLLLTVKSLDGYESYGECVLALKSMIGSTAQQFHTYLSHRGEETGNIRGSMRVRVPSERMGTRERLYEWISVDKDETGGPKGKSTMVSRVGHEYVKPSVVRKQLGELGKVSEEGERSSKEETAARPKQDAPDGDPSISKNSYNNPAYYILEGVPNQSAAALSPELLPSPTSANPQVAKAPPPCAGARTKPPYVGSGQSHTRRPMTGHPVRAISEEGSSEDDGGASVAGAQGDLAEVRIPAASPAAPLALGEGFRRVGGGGGGGVGGGGGGPGALDDQSCSVLQMAKTLSESEFPGQPPRAPSAPPPLRGQPMGLGLDACRTFPPRNPITESIAEDMPEEALWGSSSSSLSVGESSVGEWLQRLGLERYEKGLLHNGWDDLEFLSDITEEDLEEAGVLDPAHKRILLESLRQQQQQQK
ncbi:Phosphatidylinositol 3,4,5-trisphosphate 5-phosphatase 2A [Collichthys lucidus]|uniref:phosphatidylinositol-3,4,5-trisphosphate 5-phosphatase n=1 Tax=Collichthys lucidus TaxID=240159 RepID=A0A4V6AQN1_COLLU|nr:Phosphatidylinositol 3,4,5-trisphosphate 5-phosphatase 2A [Collichthys lucidus]